MKRHSVPLSQLKLKERAEILVFYIENNRSIVKTVHVYRNFQPCHTLKATMDYLRRTFSGGFKNLRLISV